MNDQEKFMQQEFENLEYFSSNYITDYVETSEISEIINYDVVWVDHENNHFKSSNNGANILRNRNKEFLLFIENNDTILESLINFKTDDNYEASENRFKPKSKEKNEKKQITNYLNENRIFYEMLIKSLKKKELELNDIFFIKFKNTFQKSLNEIYNTLEFYEILGNEHLIKTLIDNIIKPCFNPKFYNIPSSTKRLDSGIVHIHGTNGSGKRTTIKALAKYLGAQLIIIDQSITMDGKLCRIFNLCKISKTKRSIIYFDHCWNKLHEYQIRDPMTGSSYTNDPKIAKELVYTLNLYDREDFKNTYVWIVIGSEQDKLNLFFYLKSWIDPQSETFTNYLSCVQRKKIILQLINQNIKVR